MNMNSKYTFHWKPSPFHGDNGSRKDFSTAAKLISHVNEKVFFALVHSLLFFVGFMEIVLFFGIAVETIPREVFEHNEFLKIGMSFSIIALLFFTVDKIITYSEKVHEDSKEYKNRYI